MIFGLADENTGTLPALIYHSDSWVGLHYSTEGVSVFFRLEYARRGGWQCLTID